MSPYFENFPAESILWLIRQRGYDVHLAGDGRSIVYTGLPGWLADAIALNYWELCPLMQADFLGRWR